MIQRFLFNILKDGLDQIQGDLFLLDPIFKQYGLSDTELASIREAFQTKPPKVKHQYARGDDDFPLYSIVLGNENETDTYIGNDGAVIFDPEDEDFGFDIKSSIWQHQYLIFCCSEHPDHTSYLYEVAKAVFVSANLDDCGVYDARFGGMDLAPDLRYLPENVFVRQFTVQGKREFERIEPGSDQGKAFKVEGIHVDKSGSSSDVGDVKTLVTIASGTEDEE